jgi:hypothetical protein
MGGEKEVEQNEEDKNTKNTTNTKDRTEGIRLKGRTEGIKEATTTRSNHRI